MVSFVPGIYYFNFSVMRFIHIDVEICSSKFFLLYHIPVCEYITIYISIYSCWTVWKFKFWHYYVQFCYKNSNIHYVSAELYMYFSWLYTRKWNSWVVKYMYYILLDIANQITKQLSPHQRYIRVSVALILYSTLVYQVIFFLSLGIFFLRGAYVWHFIVALCFSPLKSNEGEQFFIIYCPL